MLAEIPEETRIETKGRREIGASRDAVACWRRNYEQTRVIMNKLVKNAG